MNGQFENRYQRNMNTFTPEENRRMKDFKICVIGCGGLGGHIIEMLARLGVGQITAVDGDVFDETNLNRQQQTSGAQPNQFRPKVQASLYNPP